MSPERSEGPSDASCRDPCNTSSNMKYLKFSSPAFPKIGQKNPRGWAKIGQILTGVIPAANPDYDHLIGGVVYWLVAFEVETGEPYREIGINAEGQAIVWLPDDKNQGYWTDNFLSLTDFYSNFEVEEIEARKFLDLWQAEAKGKSENQ